MEIMIEEAPNWDIGIIAGVPSWCIMLIEKIIERYQLDSIHDIWPNLKVYVHGGVFIQPYLKRLERVAKTPLHCLNTYLASEGYFAYQLSTEREGMKLLIHSGVFYEFIPFDSEHFENGNLINRHKALTLDEVEKGIDYALVISTNAGLWRYIIGDLVQFTDVDNREIKITGRIKQYLSLAGEHLSMDNINEAIVRVCQNLKVEIQEFAVFADKANLNHRWTLGIDAAVDQEEVLKEIDKSLALLNDDYATCRKFNLGNPIVKVIPTNYFYEFMEKLGKIGSQNKFPRVMNEFQASQWDQFLKEKENQ